MIAGGLTARLVSTAGGALFALLLTAAPCAGAWLLRSSPTLFIPALVVAAAITGQIARTFVVLSFPPPYPRCNYYGAADIAPESRARLRSERLCLGIVAAAFLAGTGASWVLATRGVPLCAAGLVAGLLALTQLVFATRGLNGRISARIESLLRGNYTLYLRSHRRGRCFMPFATVLATRGPLVTIISPTRVESRSARWYLLAILFPLSFSRFRFWSTTNEEWDRVAASCMWGSAGIIVDLEAVGAPNGTRVATGLFVESGISLAFASRSPAAYVLPTMGETPRMLPTPALLRVGTVRPWHVARVLRIARRLEAVISRTLPPGELEFLDRYHREFIGQFQDAVLEDRLRACREGRADPTEYLLRRREGGGEGGEANGPRRREPERQRRAKARLPRRLDASSDGDRRRSKR